MTKLVCATAAILALMSTANAAQPSIDCRKAKTPDEYLLCQYTDLTDLDWRIYRGWKSHRHIPGVKDAARSHVYARRTCGADYACIRSVQVNAVEFYAQLDGAAPLSQTVQSINSDLHNECLRAATRMSMWRERIESRRLVLAYSSNTYLTSFNADVDRFNNNLRVFNQVCQGY